MISGTITDGLWPYPFGQTTEAFYNSLRHAKTADFRFELCVRAERTLASMLNNCLKISETMFRSPKCGLTKCLWWLRIWVQKRWRHTLKNGLKVASVNIVGGCCGTTPEHIKAFADAMKGIAPRKLPEIKTAMRLSGLEPLNIDDESLFVNVGERNNVTGSAKFKRLIKEDKFSGSH